VFGSLLELDRSGEPTLLRDLHALFTRDTADRLRTLREAATARNADALWFSAHTMKGSAGTLGAIEMADLCRRIEDSANAHDFAEAGRLVEELDREADRVTRALTHAIEEA
jgi:HPt (histidine-containing phosphotransfer) domain-containing protein